MKILRIGLIIPARAGIHSMVKVGFFELNAIDRSEYNRAMKSEGGEPSRVQKKKSDSASAIETSGGQRLRKCTQLNLGLLLRVAMSIKEPKAEGPASIESPLTS